MPNRTAGEILQALQEGLGGSAPDVFVATLKARMAALSDVDRATLAKFKADNDVDIVPDEYPSEAPPGVTIRSVRQLFPQLANVPAPDGPDFEPFTVKYENFLDVLTWIGEKGPVRLDQMAHGAAYRQAVRRVQRCHTMPGQPWSSNSGFVYPIGECTVEAPIRLAVFGDQGMETGPVRWIAPHMADWLRRGDRARSLALHLGDIYYTGNRTELARYVEDLQPVCAAAELWSIPGDHERFTEGGGPFWEALDRLREGGKTRQQGGYFTLRNSAFQLVAVDAFAEQYARLPEDEAPDPNDRQGHPGHAQRKWLSTVFDGPAAGRTNLLFSQAPPHRPGSGVLKEFGEDMARCLGDAAHRRVQGWFWGDVHHAGVYLPTDQRPYASFLAGHAGRPVKIPAQPDPAANCIFWETAPRFPAEWHPAVPIAPGSADARHLAIQRRRLRNGWVQVTLHPTGEARFCYVDWMGNPRFSGRLRPGVDRAVLTPDQQPTLLP